MNNQEIKEMEVKLEESKTKKICIKLTEKETWYIYENSKEIKSSKEVVRKYKKYVVGWGETSKGAYYYAR